MDVDADGLESSSATAARAKDDTEPFESSIDTAFLRLADRLVQNAEQVLRYEFRSAPLLYGKGDAVEECWRGQRRRGDAGGERVFELQLIPHAITELEAEDVGLQAMQWGTVVLWVGLCAAGTGD